MMTTLLKKTAAGAMLITAGFMLAGCDMPTGFPDTVEGVTFDRVLNSDTGQEDLCAYSDEDRSQDNLIGCYNGTGNEEAWFLDVLDTHGDGSERNGE